MRGTLGSITLEPEVTEFTASQLDDMRHQLATPEGALDAGLALLDVVIQRSQDELGEIADVYRQMAETMIRRNIDTIYKHSGSPIESLFWSSLAHGFLVVDPFGAMFLPPTANAPDLIRTFREDLLVKDGYLKAFEATGRTDIGTWISELAKEHPHKSLPPVEELRQHHYEAQLELHSTWRLTLQAGFPTVRVDGRSVRVDMLAWIPASVSPGIVIECDGFAFHGDKSSFERDRRRDRALQRDSGLRVLRFAGPEIYRHPCAVAVELFAALRKAREGLLSHPA